MFHVKRPQASGLSPNGVARVNVSDRVMRRLRELAGRYGMRDDAVVALAAILELEAEDPAASTTVRDPAAAVDRHVADSLVALDLDSVQTARAIVDVGSGAGWPGLALAAALPRARVTLLESAVRHCRYLERAVETSGLANVDVVNARAESWPEGIGRHDLVTARALAALPVSASTRRRCWRLAVCSSRGRARSTLGRPRTAPRPPRSSAWSRSRCAGRCRTPMRANTPCTSSARRRPRPTAFHGGPEWRRNAP